MIFDSTEIIVEGILYKIEFFTNDYGAGDGKHISVGFYR